MFFVVVVVKDGDNDNENLIKNDFQSKNKGLWMIGPEAGQFNGGLAHRFTHCC